MALRSLRSILPRPIAVDVVDIGANPIEGAPPYARLLKDGGARVVGFEPSVEAIGALTKSKGPHEIYYPYAIGDGQIHNFHVCQAPGMSSILEPNPKLLAQFHNFAEWGKVLRVEQIATTRLDEIAEIESIDLLHVDVQGYELEIFKHATTKLREALVIHTEANFLPLYRDQPLFADVDSFLRSVGFQFHKFAHVESRAVKPLIANRDTRRGFGQLLWCDAVYVRDFLRFAELKPEKLLKLAIILHDIYDSFDLACQALMAYDQKRQPALVPAYMQLLNTRPTS